jgi:drug/metabolite transporter (DMT)-like permease
LWGVLSKLIGETLSPAMSQALSTLGLMPVMVAAALARQVRGGPRPRKLGKAYAFGAGASAAWPTSRITTPLKSAGKRRSLIPLTGLYPVVTVVLSIVLLGERINAVQTAGVGPLARGDLPLQRSRGHRVGEEKASLRPGSPTRW